MLAALALVVLIAGARRSWLGLSRPAGWPRAIALGAGAGVAIQALALVAIEVLVKVATGFAPDVSQFDCVRGDTGALVQWLAIVWIGVVFIEEWGPRGAGREPRARLGGVREFGLAHAYQGVGGVLSTGVVGLLLALLFVRARWNLSPAVIAHGTIDTIGLAMIYANLDRAPGLAP